MSATLDEAISLPPPSFANPFIDLIGSEPLETGKGWAKSRLFPRPELTNMHGAAHGGVLMTLIDSTMARAAMSQHGFRMSVVSTGVTVNFLAPGLGPLITHARVTGGGKSTCFCEAEITDEQGKVVAKGLGTFVYRKPPSDVEADGSTSAKSIE